VPFLISPESSIDNDSRVLSLAISEDGRHIAISNDDGNLRIYNSKGSNVATCEIEGRSGVVVKRNSGGFISGAIEGHLYAIDCSGKISWKHEVGGGVEDIKSISNTIVCLDGSGILHLLDSNGRLKSTIKIPSPEKIVFDEKGRAIAVISSDGSVRTYAPSGELMFEREPRNDRGERITAACFDYSGHLIIARETLGLAIQGEDEIEVEWWTPLGEMVDIQGLKSRCTELSPYFTGVLAGTFEGDVYILGRKQEMIDLWKSPYAINSLTCLENDILVASWFNIYRITGPGSESNDEPLWQVEHEGIVEFVSLDKEQKMLCIGGEDRNDYTGEEPVLILNPHSEPKWFEEGSDDPWIQDLEIDEDANNPVGELDISDDYSSFLTKDEQKKLDNLNDSENTATFGDLMDDLTGDDGTDKETFEQESSHEELMQGMVEDIGAHRISPIANSGDDRIINSEKDGTAVVTLDGGESYDPHERIERWTWKDGRGVVIGEIPKIRVRLPKGKHRFELSVLDDDGVWTTDITFITVQ